LFIPKETYFTVLAKGKALVRGIRDGLCSSLGRHILNKKRRRER